MIETTGLKEIIKPENLVYRRTDLLTDNTLSYCPGCGHGTVHRILAEIIEEMDLQSTDYRSITGWVFGTACIIILM